MFKEFKYCPYCSGYVEYKHIPDDTQLRHVCTQCNSIHYLNPKIVTGVLPIYDDKILLAKRAIEPCKGLWNVPAGYMENGETIEDGAQRELQEEANAKVTNIRPHLIYSLEKINQVYVLFLGDLVGPTFSKGIESLDVELFAEEEIPWSELAFTSSAVCIKRYFDNKETDPNRVHLEKYHFDKKE